MLFDRDGTLIRDVPYNGDPEYVVPMPTVADALGALRRRGVLVGVVSNQSGIARGLLTRREVDAVNARVDGLRGPFDVWRICPQGEDDGCACRKPAPGMVVSACRALGVAPSETALIGDIAADMGAASAAGVHGILVPNTTTRRDEVRGAAEVAATVGEAVRRLLGEGGST